MLVQPIVPRSPYTTTMRQVTLAVVGCGQRGSVYSALAIDEPDRVKVVAVVDPRPEYR
jgi:predicted dehydrogenase